MKHTSTIQRTLDLVIGRRIFTTCWVIASLGISIVQMRLLAQAWLVLPHALAPAWLLPAVAGLIALTCCLPLLALDSFLCGCAPLPRSGSVAASWIGRYWTADRWQLQLDQRTRPLRWWWSFLRERSQDSQGYLPLSLMASGVAVILGGIWGAVPTPFAASLGATHTLDKLAWLLGGQLVILVLAMGLLCAARDVIGFPGRLVPVSVRSRVRTLALFMPLAMAGGLVALGLPFLQTPWWLAVSLAGYTLAGAVWGILLPRLRPAFGVAVAAQRHLALTQSARPLDSLHLAHGSAREACVTRLFATVEGVLMALFTPLLGWLIDESRSVDTVLVMVGLVFALALACSLLALGASFRRPVRMQRTTTRLAVALEA